MAPIRKLEEKQMPDVKTRIHEAAEKAGALTQYWERRGAAVYGEDKGPGTAPLIIELHENGLAVTEIRRLTDEIQQAVDHHNGMLADAVTG
jgi:hypothetical protein